MGSTDESFDTGTTRRSNLLGGIVFLAGGLFLTWMCLRWGFAAANRHGELIEVWPWSRWVMAALGLIPFSIALVGLFHLLVQPSWRCWIERRTLQWEHRWHGFPRRDRRGQIHLDDLEKILFQKVRTTEDSVLFRMRLATTSGQSSTPLGKRIYFTASQVKSLREALARTAPSIEVRTGR